MTRLTDPSWEGGEYLPRGHAVHSRMAPQPSAADFHFEEAVTRSYSHVLAGEVLVLSTHTHMSDHMSIRLWTRLPNYSCDPPPISLEGFLGLPAAGRELPTSRPPPCLGLGVIADGCDAVTIQWVVSDEPVQGTLGLSAHLERSTRTDHVSQRSTPWQR